MGKGLGKIAENLKVHCRVPEAIGAVTVYWNGQSITSASGYGYDALGYREALVNYQTGTLLGQRASLVVAVYESDTDDPTAATAISGANFTVRNSANDETNEEGSILLNPRKRYLFLREEVQNAFSTTETATIHVAGQMILGDKQTDPVSKTLIFDTET
jgi:hypothetical protein